MPCRRKAACLAVSVLRRAMFASESYCKYNYEHHEFLVKCLLPIKTNDVYIKLAINQDTINWSRRPDGHHYLYTCDIFAFTVLSASSGSNVRIRSTNSSRSVMRNKDRPAATTTNGSIPAASVQLVGTECRRPSLSWNHTRSSPQFWRQVTSSNSC